MLTVAVSVARRTSRRGWRVSSAAAVPPVLRGTGGGGLARTASNTAAAGAGQPSIESMYQRKTPVEHVLLRPGMYIGGTQEVGLEGFVWDAAKQQMKPHTSSYVPGLLKLFDELLVNAVDHKRRDSSMDRIDVEIFAGDGKQPPRISVRNSGNGLPVVKHKGEDMYVPELVFGHLLTGSNFNDEEGRVTGGAFGYGAKLTNIFSKEFVVETADKKSKKVFRQVFQDNLSSRSAPQITKLDADTQPYTCVEFVPDLQRFGITNGVLPAGTLAQLERRVVDVAGTVNSFNSGPPVAVHLNGTKISIDSFEAYVGAFSPSAPVFTSPSSRMEVAISPAEGFTAVSFVNGVHTLHGGTHVDAVVDQVCKKASAILEKAYPDLNIRPANVKSHLQVFVNCLVEKPTFSSQSKDWLSTAPEAFGYTLRISDKYVKELLAAGLEDAVVGSLRSKEDAALRRQARKVKNSAIRNIPKLEDANDAGTRDGRHCTLILTEGDSAKSLAVAGLAVVGRDRYGVFPLRGKLLNVRDASKQDILNNAEIANLITILGLDITQTYAKVAPEKRGLRYGKVMIMTDQDHDGSHIKGLLVNMFHKLWPALLEANGFLEQFITPIIKARSGKSTVKEFFSMNEYAKWRQSMTEEQLARWSIKYYKGLGTSTSAEGREYFTNLAKHRRQFVWTGEGDGAAIDQAFGKAHVGYRKDWLATSPAGDVDYTKDWVHQLSYTDFVNKELIQFSRADLARSIPSVVDGLKPSQRKVLFGSFKRNLTAEVKVAQLAGYIAEHTGYHHGEASLHATIVGMAQNFVGANNLPLLEPIGQFGTRLQGGKDAASARYIFTKLSPLARMVFPRQDDAILERVEDDGQLVEPVYFTPIIPMALVNGVEGIGTGWSTHVPAHNPSELAVWLLRKLGDKDPTVKLPARLLPWYAGFQGSILPDSTKDGFVCRGVVDWDGRSCHARISELPVGTWTDDYKASLVNMIESGFLLGFKEYHTETSASFELQFSPAAVETLSKDDMMDKLRLVRRFKTSNMHFFDASGNIKRYETAEQVIEDFFPVRQAAYERRKEHLLAAYEVEATKQAEVSRFLSRVVSGDIPVSRMSKDKLQGKLVEQKFAQYKGSYDYLMNLPMWHLTADSVVAADNAAAQAHKQLDALRGTAIETMWKEELRAFLDATRA